MSAEGCQRIVCQQTRPTNFVGDRIERIVPTKNVGERIARKWSLAPLTTGCIRFHHLDGDVPEEFAEQVRVVSLADAGARRLGVGIAEPDENPEREACLLEALSFPRDGFEEILARYAEKSSETESLFSNLGGVP